jgi:hypothetical protein
MKKLKAEAEESGAQRVIFLIKSVSLIALRIFNARALFKGFINFALRKAFY